MIKKLISRRIRKAKRWKCLLLDSRRYPLTQYGDGYGYMVYDKILGGGKKNQIVYSFGIGGDLSFSEALLKRFGDDGMQVYAFDPTPKSISYVKKHSLANDSRFHFYPYGLSDKDETVQFFLPENEADYSGSSDYRRGMKTGSINVQMRRLNTLLNLNGHNHIDLMKMDIEGSEFKAVADLPNCIARIDQICVEVHDRFYEDGIERLKEMVSTLRKMGYLLVGISRSKLELTFVLR